jgi:hypothetical protein
MDSEHRERKAANIAWLRKAFSDAKASNGRGLALLTQANPHFENYWPTGQKDTYLRMIPGARAPEKAEATGYDSLRSASPCNVVIMQRPTATLDQHDSYRLMARRACDRRPPYKREPHRSGA